MILGEEIDKENLLVVLSKFWFIGKVERFRGRNLEREYFRFRIVLFLNEGIKKS